MFPQVSGTVLLVRCPGCLMLDDKVVDSRLADDGAAIRRRRECLTCGRRFTTFERLEDVPLVVLKRSGDRAPFDRGKVVSGVAAAAKGRPILPEVWDQLAADVEEEVRLCASSGEVSSEQVGKAVLARLGIVDHVAYLRFASVYKGFEDATDFERELAVLTKVTEPKRH